MNAEFIPEILEVRISREELLTLKKLAAGYGDLVRMFGANVETKAMLLTLLTVLHRADCS